MTYDPHSSSAATDVYELYRVLRDCSPVHRHDRENAPLRRPERPRRAMDGTWFA